MSRISIIYDDSISTELCGKIKEALDKKNNNVRVLFFSGRDIDIDFIASFPDLKEDAKELPRCTFYAVATLWKTGTSYSIFPYDDPDLCCLYPPHKDFYGELSCKLMKYLGSEFLQNSLFSICRLHNIPRIYVLKRKEIKLTVCKVHFLSRLKEHKQKVEDNPEIFFDSGKELSDITRETNICSAVSESSAVSLSFVSRSVSTLLLCLTVRINHFDRVSFFEPMDIKDASVDILEKLQDRLKEFFKKIMEECGLAISLKIVEC